MLDFNYVRDPSNGEEWVETNLTGKLLLNTTQLNKGTAFTEEERRTFKLLGKLPLRVETIEEQVTRAYKQLQSFDTNLRKNVYLNALHDRMQVLFYRLAGEHLAEILPMIYTPIVGTAVKKYSQEFRQPRGIYLSYPERDRMAEILGNRSHPTIKLIVCTDGEGVLGIGDQGIGGMDIPIAKLMVYTLCGGICPYYTLPILLDVGTNNEYLLNDPMYLGWRHERISGATYDSFIDQFVSTVNQQFPQVFLHWEDFGRTNARRNLERHQAHICAFNDDMQGTGAVTLAALLAAIKANGSTLAEQRIVVFGAGTAGTGISDQICDAMVHEGLPREQAQRLFWLLDRSGLITEDSEQKTPEQCVYAQPASEWPEADAGIVDLATVVKKIKPTVLVGTSAVTGAFTEEVIRSMAAGTERPIIFPLSNPTERAEATPQDLMEWTNGKAFIATGSPFDPVEYQGKTIPIAQCNNALVFPGIGLGMVAAKPKKLTEEMLWAATVALGRSAAVIHDPNGPLLPSLDAAREVAQAIAVAVVEQAVKEKLTDISPDTNLEELIDSNMWRAHYVPYRLKS